MVLTDHKNLERFTTTKKLNRRQACWNELLAEFDFKIVFRPGKHGGKPDALTRIHSDRPTESADERNRHQYQTLIKPHQTLRCSDTHESSTSLDVSLDNWNNHCREDKYCQEIRSALENTKKTRTDIELSNCSLTKYSFTLNGKEYIPEVLRETILNQLHESPLYGHRGAAALYSLVTRQYWWPGCHKDASKYARGCESCQRNNPSSQKPYGFLKPLPPPKASFRHLTLDFIGPLPTYKVRDFSYRYILQVVDRLTKRV
ncbi:hypothetical protein K3495_g9885 [Podosphaera aphanis]|nr:hypothetical protein K3495_g9885 [Podosphaera aphanis]